MHPVLFDVGPLTLHTYGLMGALGLLVGMALPSWMTRNQDWPKDFFWFNGLLVIPLGILFGRLEYVRQHWERFADDPSAILQLSDGGLVFHGGALGGLLGIWLAAKIKDVDVWRMCDALAPTFGFSVFLARLGCLGAGCCYGQPTDLPWGIVFEHPDSIAPLGVALHPTQVTAALFEGLFLGAAMWWLYPRRRFDGQVALTLGVLYPLVRSANEMLRGDGERGWLLEDVLGQTLTPAQGFSIVLAMLSLRALLRRWPSETSPPPAATS